MANPLVSQGTLNRLLASVVIPDEPQLNVTAPFLGDGAVGIAFGGESTTFIDALTGRVTSPEPYIPVSVSVHLLKTQNLAAQYKAQMEDDARIGDITVRPDSRTLPVYQFTNCAIQGVDELTFNGKDAGYRVRIAGTYPVNGALFSDG